MLPRTLTRGLCLLLLALATAGAWASAASAQSTSGASILVVTSTDRFGQFYPEILRAEGLNAFDVADLEDIDAAGLASYDVVLLAGTALTTVQADLLGAWVGNGGNLVAMRPDPKLAGILGLEVAAGEQVDAYLKAEPSAGVTTETLQVHARAQRWSLAGADRVATLYSDAATPTSWPAVTRHSVGGAGGEAAAFSFDLARSVVYTRQGNPEAVDEEHDGAIPDGRRSGDLFLNPDWADDTKIRIPQADEQQRLLANLITTMARDRMPMPRFWYLPRGEKAAVVMTGDDHGQGGTDARFKRRVEESPVGCSLADWDCVRATSYMYPSGPFTKEQATAWQAAGFELALHLDTTVGSPSECVNNAAALDGLWTSQLASFASSWPALRAPVTSRTHCVAWDGWTTTAERERAYGIRLDTNYYYWPETWAEDHPGLFTGSGFPMRFAKEDGTPVDVYQAATLITDEWAGDKALGKIPEHIRTLLDGALGPNGYYGAFTVNMHNDEVESPGADAIVMEATARGVPVVSAEQMLEWLDGRNGSSFRQLRFADGHLTFTLDAAPAARGLEAMLPAAGFKGLTRDGAPVAVSARSVKGIDYAVFAGASGAYAASYAGDSVAALPAAQSPPPTPPAAKDSVRPQVKLKTRKVRAKRNGRITLLLACPRTEIRCFVDLRLRHKGKNVAGARARFTVAGAKTARITLRLSRKQRKALRHSGAQRMVVVLRVRDAAGNRRTTRPRLRVLAPRGS